jgi:FdhD protein
MREAVRRVPVVRLGRSSAEPPHDAVAVEEPLEVRLHGQSFAVIMRTPGDDKELAAGFLLSEGVLTSSADLGAVEHCRHPQHPESHNIVDVFVLASARERVEHHLRERRNVVTSSSCGLCGRVTIESLQCRATALPVLWQVSAETVASLPRSLRCHQRLFDETGGLHAAGLFEIDGGCFAAAEDVGRHNAVDKVVGRMLMAERLPLDRAMLAVSGRASFEIVQKAWIAGVPLLCAVSAPSSLAIDLAQTAGITLVGFARGAAFNVYSHPERLGNV